MAARKYKAVFVTERPYYGTRYVYDTEAEKWTKRVFSASITCDPKTLFCERINLAGGLPVLWQHGGFWGRPSPAVGKVLKMEFMGRKLVGELEIDEGNLESYAPGGLEALSRGVNSGLSAGMHFMSTDGGKMTIRDGTFDKPDQFKYGKMNIIEMSLTPTPRIADCGLMGEIK